MASSSGASELEDVKQEIKELKADLKSLPPHDPERLLVQRQLAALREKEVLLMQIAGDGQAGVSTEEGQLTIMNEKLDKLAKIVEAKASATIYASKISPANLSKVHSASQTVVVFLKPGDHERVETLIGNRDLEENFWDVRPEPAQRSEYEAKFNKEVPCKSGLIWKDATGQPSVKRTIGSMLPTVAAKNDLVLVVEIMATDLMATGSVIGIELKKGLTRQGIRQAQAEFLLWSDAALFPYVQLITDMNVGGIAYYYSGEVTGGFRIIREHVLPDMDAVWKFLTTIMRGFPDKIGEPRRGGIVFPEKVANPKRVKLALEPLSAGPSAPGRAQDAHELLAQLLNNEDDVACLHDVEDVDAFRKAFLESPCQHELPPMMYC